MLMIIYVVLAWITTPLAMEFINTRTQLGNNKVLNVIKGWPAYATNVIVCALIALVVCFLPGGWKISLSSWLLLTAVVYFGNQFFFNSIVKPVWAHRKKS